MSFTLNKAKKDMRQPQNKYDHMNNKFVGCFISFPTIPKYCYLHYTNKETTFHIDQITEISTVKQGLTPWSEPKFSVLSTPFLVICDYNMTFKLHIYYSGAILKICFDSHSTAALTVQTWPWLGKWFNLPEPPFPLWSDQIIVNYCVSENKT